MPAEGCTSELEQVRQRALACERERDDALRQKAAAEEEVKEARRRILLLEREVKTLREQDQLLNTPFFMLAGAHGGGMASSSGARGAVARQGGGVAPLDECWSPPAPPPPPPPGFPATPTFVLSDLSPSAAAAYVAEDARGLLGSSPAAKAPRLADGASTPPPPPPPPPPEPTAQRREQSQQQTSLWLPSPVQQKPLRRFPNVRPIRRFSAPDERPWPLEVSRPIAQATAGADNDEDDGVCSVCGNGECADDDAILICDGCDMMAHQSCYAIPNVPEGSWYCPRCEDLRARGMLGQAPAVDTHLCALCPCYGGALWSISGKMPAGVQPIRWAHAACAIWTPEVKVTFVDPENEGDNPGVHVNVSKISPARVNLGCRECKQKGGGVVQCMAKSCMAAYHVTCARHGGCITDYAENVKGEVQAVIFCPKHSAPELSDWRASALRGGSTTLPAPTRTSPGKAPA